MEALQPRHVSDRFDYAGCIGRSRAMFCQNDPNRNTLRNYEIHPPHRPCGGKRAFALGI